MLERAPDHILRDLSAKVADDVADRIRMSAQFLPDPSQKMMLAIAAVGTAMGYAAGFSDMKLALAGQKMTPDESVDLMIRIARPIALAALGGDDADFQELLTKCRD